MLAGYGYRDGPSQDAMCSVFTPLFHFSLAICYTAAQLALEVFANHIVPSRFKASSNLRPLDRLKMPEDEQEPPLLQRHHTAPVPVSESRHAHLPKPSEHKTVKLRSSSAMKYPSSKQHRSSSKRQEYAQVYASGEILQPKVHKERSRSRRRHRDKTTETEPKTTAGEETVKPVEYSNSSKFDQFNMRSDKYVRT